MAEALYRKYRPQVFSDVVGQEHIERTIKNAIEQNKVSHAYLFTGPRGTGKTTTARLLAKALLCENGPTPTPDGTCSDCVAIANGEHPDVYELDAASRTGVDNVREEIIGRVQFAPTRGRYKVYIIDEVHMLSIPAFNALLKTLEEPPSHVVFIMCTTDPQKVPETIHSRCQRFDFHRISREYIVERLVEVCEGEEVEYDKAALELVAQRAEGGMRNALTSLEQLIAFGEGKVSLDIANSMLGSLDSADLQEVVRAVGVRDVAACFGWVADYVETGSDLAQFTRDFAEYVRNMYVLSLTQGKGLPSDGDNAVSEALRAEMMELMPLYGPDRLSRLLGVLGDLLVELKTSLNPRLSFEIALTRMVRPDSDLTLEALAERIEALEAGLSATAVVLPGAASAAVQAAAVAQPRRETLKQERPKPSENSYAEQSVSVAPRADEPSVRVEQPAAQPVAQVAQPAAQPVQVAQVAQPAQVARPIEPAAASAGASGRRAGGSVSDNLRESMRNPATLQRIWQAALNTLKTKKTAYGVLFINSQASFDEARSLMVVKFPEENAFAFGTAQRPDVMEMLATALQQACGEPVPFTLTRGSSVVTGPSSQVGASAQSAARPAQREAAQPAQPAQREAQPARREAAQSAQREAQPARTTAQATQAATQSSPQPAANPSRYDDVPPYDDEQVPYDDVDASFESDYALDSASQSRQRSVSSAVYPAQVSDVPVRDAAVDADAAKAGADDGSIDDLEGMFTATFGEGVVFEEV